MPPASRPRSSSARGSRATASTTSPTCARSRSIGDVEFTNDYKLLGLGDKPHLFKPTPTGYAQSAWTIGPAIVWAPFFAAAHPIAGRLAAGGADVSTNGISYPYRQAVCIAGLFYGLLGCWFI